MNNVELIGRLVKDPEVKYTSGQDPMAILRTTIAIDRPTKQGDEKKADFPSVVVFGKQAENCGKYLKKGSMIAVTGRIQTGSYKNKEGDDVYTTDVIAARVEFLSYPKESKESKEEKPKDVKGAEEQGYQEVMSEEEIPF